VSLPAYMRYRSPDGVAEGYPVPRNHGLWLLLDD